MSKIISILENKPLEDQIKSILKTGNFVVLYTDKDGSTIPIQGDINMNDLALYKAILDYMAITSMEMAFSGVYDEE